MNIPLAIVKDIIILLNEGFNFEGNVYGILHNSAIDTIRWLEQRVELEERK